MIHNLTKDILAFVAPEGMKITKVYMDGEYLHFTSEDGNRGGSQHVGNYTLYAPEQQSEDVAVICVEETSDGDGQIFYFDYEDKDNSLFNTALASLHSLYRSKNLPPDRTYLLIPKA